jgi:hypothetical protein
VEGSKRVKSWHLGIVVCCKWSAQVRQCCFAAIAGRSRFNRRNSHACMTSHESSQDYLRHIECWITAKSLSSIIPRGQGLHRLGSRGRREEEKNIQYESPSCRRTLFRVSNTTLQIPPQLTPSTPTSSNHHTSSANRCQ